MEKEGSTSDIEERPKRILSITWTEEEKKKACKSILKVLLLALIAIVNAVVALLIARIEVALPREGSNVTSIAKLARQTWN